jgi:epoxyqueuosine reductase
MTKPIPRPDVHALTQSIKRKAHELGFNKVGICRAESLDGHKWLEEWLNKGYDGEMQWIARSCEERLDPSKLLPQVRSIITLAANYYLPGRHSELPDHGKISRYAWGKDYHSVLRTRLKNLTKWVLETEPGAQGLYYCDTGPIMEKVWAQRSGLGWIGKHSNLITRELGSWVFLAEILTSLELEVDRESRNYCGTCRQCIDMCPTRAIVAPGVVDARRCVSYLTIELRGPIPRELRARVGTRIFGCDDCQDVCPRNRFARPSSEADFSARPENQAPILLDLIAMTAGQFQQCFRQNPVRRAGYAGFLRNVAVALGNAGDEKAVEALEKALTHPEPLVRGHAAWALGEIRVAGRPAALLEALSEEGDTWVREEIGLALQDLGAAP